LTIAATLRTDTSKPVTLKQFMLGIAILSHSG
jgi:hypothetical protein